MPKPYFPGLFAASAQPSRVTSAGDSCPTQDCSKKRVFLENSTLAWPRFSPNCAASWHSSLPTLTSLSPGSPCRFLSPYPFIFHKHFPWEISCTSNLSSHLFLGRTRLAQSYPGNAVVNRLSPAPALMELRLEGQKQTHKRSFFLTILTKAKERCGVPWGNGLWSLKLIRGSGQASPRKGHFTRDLRDELEFTGDDIDGSFQAKTSQDV